MSDDDTPGPPPLLSEMKDGDRKQRLTITAHELQGASLTKPQTLANRTKTTDELNDDNLNEMDSIGKVFKQGYVMGRVGLSKVAALKHWEVRFIVLLEIKDRRGEPQVCLEVYTNHYKDTKKHSYVLTPGVTTVCPIERDAYDEGRRSNLFGIRLKQGVRKFVFDAESFEVMQDWMSVLGSVSLENVGLHSGDRMDKSSVKEGWLVKRGGATKTWKRRYFVLLPQMIAYYKTKSAKRAQGFIPISKTMVAAPHERGPAYLSVSNPPPEGQQEGGAMGYGREYVMRAYDERHRDEWIDALTGSIDAMK